MSWSILSGNTYIKTGMLVVRLGVFVSNSDAVEGNDSNNNNENNTSDNSPDDCTSATCKYLDAQSIKNTFIL